MSSWWQIGSQRAPAAGGEWLVVRVGTARSDREGSGYPFGIMPVQGSDGRTVFCPAKLNLGLSVGPPGHDGYHPIASWMVALRFGDSLTVRAASTPNSTFDVAFDGEAPWADVVDWPLDDDLTVRAHRLVQEHVGRPLPVQARLTKQIPPGAGLGGGSSDAAAMLLALNDIFELGLDGACLNRLAAKLGSDVPFAVGALGSSPSAIVTGRGQRIDPVPLPEPIRLVLILPPFGCSTRDVYGAFDKQASGPPEVDEKRVRDLARLRPVRPNGPFNDLAEAAIAVEPGLGRLLGRLRDEHGYRAHVSGSGSAVFVLVPSQAAGKALAREVSATIKVPALATITLESKV